MSGALSGAAGHSRALRRLLSALARPDAVARVETEGAAIRAAYVMRSHAPDADVIHRGSHEEWAHVIANGLVEPGAASGIWIISGRGRAELGSISRDVAALQTPQKRDRTQQPARPEASRPRLNLAESPLAWLASRKDRNGVPLLSQEQFDAGERLRVDFERAALQQRVTANWEAFGANGSRTPYAGEVVGSLSDRALAAREAVNRALKAVGPELSGALVDICCHLKGLEQIERELGWPQRSGKIVLQLALNALARHYGIASRRTDEGHQPSRVLHWGSEGYRPAPSSEE